MSVPEIPSRIGLLGDVHADVVALKASLEWFRANDISCVLCTGDIMNGPGDADECCSLLRQHVVPTVRGNHDRWFVTGQLSGLPHATVPESVSATNRTWLKALPSTLVFTIGNIRLLLCHGIGENDMAGLRSDDYGYGLEVNEPLRAVLLSVQWEYVLCGHTHQPMIRRFTEVTFLNPGALYREHGGTFAYIDFEATQLQLLSVDGVGHIQTQGLYDI